MIRTNSRDSTKKTLLVEKDPLSGVYLYNVRYCIRSALQLWFKQCIKGMKKTMPTFSRS